MSALMIQRKLFREHSHDAAYYAPLMDLGQRIEKYRGIAKLNKSELARACNVDPSAINKLESGDTKTLSGDLLIKLAKKLAVNPAWLQTGEGEETLNGGLSQEELSAIKNLRSIPIESARDFYVQIARMAYLYQALAGSNTVTQSESRQRKTG